MGSTLQPTTLERLYLEHEPRVRWTLHARGVSASSVDDLVHETFVAIARRFAQRDPTIPLRSWIVGVARNVAFSHRRAEARRRRHLERLPAPEPTALPDVAVAHRQAWRTLERFTAGLSPKLREVFILADVAGTPVNEVAESLGIPVATSHSRLRLARRSFAEHFAADTTAAQREALIARAAAGCTTTPRARRRSVAAVLAAIQLPAKTAIIPMLGLGNLAVLGSGLAIAGTVALTIGELRTAAADAAGSPNPSASHVPTAAALDSRRDRGATNEPEPTPPLATASAPAVGHALAVAGPPTAARPRARARATAKLKIDPTPPITTAPHPVQPAKLPHASGSSEHLRAHVHALERARTQVRAANFEAALQTLDRITAADRVLVRDHLRIEIQAACGTENAARVRIAVAALANLGIPSDTRVPCGDPAPDPT